MHPNPLFRTDDRTAMEEFAERTGFCTVFLTTPAGPRAARTPLIRFDAGRFQFHLAKHNALVDHLPGATALVTVDGPEGYVSPRWYDDRDTVPTWNYVAVEFVGPIRRIADDELETFLHALIDRQERALPGSRWTAEETSETVWKRLFKGIAGFELTVREWRPTFKLSQNKSAGERATIAAGLERAGRSALAAAMRGDAA